MPFHTVDLREYLAALNPLYAQAYDNVFLGKVVKVDLMGQTGLDQPSVIALLLPYPISASVLDFISHTLQKEIVAYERAEVS